MQQGLLSGFNPSDAYSQNLRQPVQGKMRLGNLTSYFMPISRNVLPYEDSPRLGARDYNLDYPQVLKDTYSGLNKFGQAFRGELTPQQIQQLAFDTSMNVAGGGLLGSKILKNAMPEGALGMNIMRPLTKEQIDPLGYGRAKGLLTRPLDETNIGYSKDIDLAPEKKLNIQDLQGSVLYPLMGDQSATGLLINSIDDIAFKTPVKLEGGAKFMRGGSNQAEGSVWASDKGIISRLDRKVKSLSEETDKPINMIYTAMGKEGVDFSTFPSGVLAEQIPTAKILKKDKKSFDSLMKKRVMEGVGSKKREKYPAVKDWVGIDSPKLREFLDTAPPSVRKKFVKIMDTAPFQQAGFPNVGKARYAVTDDALKTKTAGDTGLVIARPNLIKKPTNDPLVPHSTYPSQMFGDYVGGLDNTVPRSLLFRDYFNSPKVKSLNNPAMQDYGFTRVLPTQEVDQQLVDTIMNYSLLNR